ncbi:unnamed protein product [Cuscuta epithymum]|uniref:MATH domain-containing protein n=1 Tax=Cuscuta epithymum TaxID=186058 RepID=A0AAV0ENZ5_9ASTE|nr:unnamed protein product [Cuscuta epithymum]
MVKRKSGEINNGERLAAPARPKIENNQTNDYLMSKFRWKIDNFSRLDVERPYSSVFNVNEYKWRLLLYPKGNNTAHLSLYLGVPDLHSLPNGWRVPTKFSLALINQLDPKKTIKKEAKHAFNADESDWGFTSFITLHEFYDKAEGYLVNDTCLIDAEVYVPDGSSCVMNNATSPVSPYQAIDSSSSSAVALDPVESVYSRVQSVLKSLPKSPSNLASGAIPCEVPLFKDRATSAKEIFDKLIAYPLEDLADPQHEPAMLESLSILTKNLSLFSIGQAEEILNLNDSFPQMMREWRELSKVKGSSEHLWATFEKTKRLLEDLVKTDEGIKSKLEVLVRREKELKAELEKIESDTQQLKVERGEVSKQTKKVCALAEEQACIIEGREAEVDGANKKMEGLKSKWDAMRLRLVA